MSIKTQILKTKRGSSNISNLIDGKHPLSHSMSVPFFNFSLFCKLVQSHQDFKINPHFEQNIFLEIGGWTVLTPGYV